MAPGERTLRTPSDLPVDFHHCERQTASIVARLEEGRAGVPEDVAKEILAFFRCTLGTVSAQRSLTYLRILTNAAQKLGKDFLEPDEQSPERFRKAYAGYAGWTILSAGAVTMTFWKWRFAKAHQPFPSGLSIRISKRLCARKDEQSVLSPEEVTAIVRSAVTIRDKAFIAVLYESGARIGELLNTRVGSVERSDHGGYRILLDGKTGRRTVPLFESSVPLLGAWLKDHPRAADRRAPLFCSLQSTDRLGRPMDYAAWSKIIRVAARRAGVEKAVNPHIFRHSRASAVAKNPAVATPVMESFFGWQHGSPMAATYVHLSGKDVEQAMARAVGAEQVSAPTRSPNLARTCGRCEWTNDGASQFCGRCAAPLDLAAARDIELVEADQRQLAKLLSRPAVRRLLVQQLREMKSEIAGG